jgi:ABC-type cobalamin/Fe3+-siderophores transport system ATPase subunit
VDETHFAEIDAAMLYIEEARARAERAAKTLRSEGADQHLVEALEGAQEQLSDVARALRQETLFAVPSGQTSF